MKTQKEKNAMTNQMIFALCHGSFRRLSAMIRDLNDNFFSLKKNVLNKNKTLFNEITRNISQINNFSNSIYKLTEEIIEYTPKIPDDILEILDSIDFEKLSLVDILEILDSIDFEKLSLVEYSILAEAINKICRSQFRAIPEAIQMF